MHILNGVKVNHFVCGPLMGSCSPTQTYEGDAEYFCKSIYGFEYNVSSFKQGQYGLDAGKLGWQIHRGGTVAQKTFCMKQGDPIQGSDCSGNPCKIVKSEGEFHGVYDVVCSSTYR